MAEIAGRARAGRPGALLVVLVLAAFAVLIALGTWQVQRLQWKEGLLATIDARLAAEPASLAEVETVWAETGDVEYRPVRLGGTFDHEKEQFFLATHEGQSGWYVYSPLRLGDGRAIIVNRGFIPYDMKDAAGRDWQEPAGAVTFTALARNPLYEKPGWIVPDNNAADNVWYWKDFPAMRQAMGLDEEGTLPFFADIRAYEGEREARFPVPGVTRVALPNSHLQYAVTWYGLAAALAAVAGFMFFRKPETDEAERGNLNE
jgi:surfeit locus 1 family protein